MRIKIMKPFEGWNIRIFCIPLDGATGEPCRIRVVWPGIWEQAGQKPCTQIAFPKDIAWLPIEMLETLVQASHFRTQHWIQAYCGRGVTQVLQLLRQGGLRWRQRAGIHHAVFARRKAGVDRHHRRSGPRAGRMGKIKTDGLRCKGRDCRCSRGGCDVAGKRVSPKRIGTDQQNILRCILRQCYLRRGYRRGPVGNPSGHGDRDTK